MTLWILATLAAWAGPLGSVPGRALVLSPCADRADAACWTKAARLTRFALDERLGAGASNVDVRLAYDGSDLLLWPRQLPDGGDIEVLIQARGTTIPHRNTGNGHAPNDVITRIPMGWTAAPGERRELRIGLRVPDGDGYSMRWWAPQGPGNADDRVQVLYSTRPHDPTHLVGARAQDGAVIVRAQGASSVRLVHLPTYEHTPHEVALDPVLDVWGPSPLRSPTPVKRGWYAIEAQWTVDGAVSDLVRRRIALNGTVPDALTGHGLHPAPRAAELLNAAPLSLGKLGTICAHDASWMGPARLLSDELRRVAAHQTNVEVCAPGDGRVWLGPADKLDGSDAPELHAAVLRHDEAFELHVASRQVRVGARTLAGGTWGALAFADLLAQQTSPVAAVYADWPAYSERVLFHRLDQYHRAPMDVEQHLQFLRRVTARGRYNRVVLTLRGAYRYTSHPELASSFAMSRDELQRLVRGVEELGVDAVPGINAPGHADWITASHPELVEDNKRTSLCTRHPGSHELLNDVYDELIEVFEHPTYLHIGHDELSWSTRLSSSSERCPRCAGTDRGVLFAEFLGRQIDALTARGVTPMLWSDMLASKWNGGRQGVATAADRLTAEQRASVLVMNWTQIGGAAQELSAKGYRVLQVPTGHIDVRRRAVISEREHLVGAGLALFVPRPWQLHGWAFDTKRVLWSHLPQIVLAGTTAWRPSLAWSDLDSSLVELHDHPSIWPGRRALSSRPEHELVPSGGEPPNHRDVFASDATVGGVRFHLRADRVATASQPVVWRIGKRVRSISILQAADLDWDARSTLERRFALAKSRDGVPIAELVVTYADGEQVRAPWIYGRATWRPGLDPGAVSLWEASGALLGASRARASADRGVYDRIRYRWDWHNPRPDATVTRAQIEVVHPGARILISAASRR